jgi:uncharacterized membrane protein
VIDLTRSHIVPAPAAAVWAVLADYRRDPEWRTGVRSMEPDTEGEPRPGTTVQEVLRIAGSTKHIGSVVDAVEPGRRVAWHTTDGSDVNGFRMVEPIGDDRCRVTLGITVRPHGAEKLMAPLFRRILGRNTAGDLVRLDDLVLGGADRRPAPAPPVPEAGRR